MTKAARPLQNRVKPSGEIVATTTRGTMMGNRGIIHDPATRTLLSKRWSTKAWIVCVCDYKENHREVMARQSWTELFFLDEATALAAGHRPCFFCRRDDANRFRAAWEQGNGVARASANDIDTTLHAERLNDKAKRLHMLPMPIDQLPDSAMVQAGQGGDAASYLIVGGRASRWSFEGYGAVNASLEDALLLTPPSTLRALLAGYRPKLHASASFAGSR